MIFTDESISFVCKDEYDALNGSCSPMGAIDRLTIVTLSDMILEGKVEANNKIAAKLIGLQIIFEKE